MKSKLLILGSALLAAGCGSPESEQTNVPAPVQGEGQKALHELDELNRAIALKRAIHDSGIQCQRIDRSAYVDEYRNLSMWAATCNDGRSWALFIGRNDAVQVRECKDLDGLDLPSCPDWTKEAKPTR